MLFAPCCHQCGKFYIEVKHFTLIPNRNVTGEDVQPLCIFSERWPCAAEYVNFQYELGFREFGQLLFLKFIKQRDLKKKKKFALFE